MKFCWVRHQKRIEIHYRKNRIIYHQDLNNKKLKDKLIKLILKTRLENESILIVKIFGFIKFIVIL